MRFLISALVAALVLATPFTAPAQQTVDREEALVQAERILAEVLGMPADGVQPIERDYGDGLKGFSMPLPAGTQLRAAKQLVTLAIGNSNITPSSASSLINVPYASCYSNYNFWFVVVNLGSNDMTASSKRQVKGANGYTKTSNITYNANTVHVFYDAHDKKLQGGLYNYFVKVSGAKTAKGSLLAVNGC